MTLWLLFALMTAAAIFAVLWPLGRSIPAANGGSEVLVYKDQLAELKRDAAAGLIGSNEAEAARIEISRRLLAASQSENAQSFTPRLAWRRAVAVLALVGIPTAAIAFYVPRGSPALRDFPLAERTQPPAATASLDRLVAQVEARLASRPDDGRGWEVLAPVLAKLGRNDDAVQAYRNSLTYNGETAERRADLGEAIAAAANGVVTSEAKTEFERAVSLDPKEVKARYFTGLAAEQDGRRSEAANIWRAMLASAPPDAPWRPIVESAMLRAGVAAPQLSDSDMSMANGMSAPDRDTMIRGMVDRLATRLKDNGDDVEGWLRLARAYMVLGDTGKARSTIEEARQALSSDADRIRQLNDGLKTLGLNG